MRQSLLGMALFSLASHATVYDINMNEIPVPQGLHVEHFVVFDDQDNRYEFIPVETAQGKFDYGCQYDVLPNEADPDDITVFMEANKNIDHCRLRQVQEAIPLKKD